MASFRVYYRNNNNAAFAPNVEAQTSDQAIEKQKAKLRKHGYHLRDFKDFTCNRDLFRKQQNETY